MRLILIALLLYIAMMSWMFYNDYRTVVVIDQTMNTVGFDYYITWTCKTDRTPKAAIKEAEAWALAVDPKTVDAVNVKQWVEYMQKGKTK